jgi:hypothetical protein
MSATIWLLAGTVTAGNVELRRLGVLSRSDGNFRLPSSDRSIVVPVLKESEMRGRQVHSGDTVTVVGDWSGRPHHEVQWLVNMFNFARVDDDAPRLHYRSGEAPSVEYPQDLSATPQTKKYMLVIDGVQIPAAALSVSDDGLGNVEVVVTTHDSNGGRWLPDGGAELVQKANRLEWDIDQAARRNRELQEWLSNVGPVEDPDIPDLYYCGVCAFVLPKHVEDCPAAP